MIMDTNSVEHDTMTDNAKALLLLGCVVAVGALQVASVQYRSGAPIFIGVAYGLGIVVGVIRGRIK